MSGDGSMNSVYPKHQASTIARRTGVTYIVHRMRIVFCGPHPPEEVDGVQTLHKSVKGVD